MKNIFSEHPKSIGKTYWQHLSSAMMTAFKMIGVGIALFIHAILPFLFVHTASNFIVKTAKRLEEQRQSKPLV